MFKRKILTLFKKGNVSICGLRGTGKDMLTANVIARRKRPYISNIDYNIKCKKATFNDLKLLQFDIKNDYKNFINDKFNHYDYPYPDKMDIYISDAGTYFPSQYSSQLDKDYKSFSSFMALSRHLGDCNVHYNVQNLNRIWNKLREQSDIYIRCNWCKVLFHKFVIQKITYYENYQSCIDNVKPFKMKLPVIHSKDGNMLYKLEKEKYNIKFGRIKSYIMIYINKSKYNDRIFKEKLAKGND